MTREDANKIANILNLDLEEKDIQDGKQFVFTPKDGFQPRVCVNVYRTGKIVYQGKNKALEQEIRETLLSLTKSKEVHFSIKLPSDIVARLENDSSATSNKVLVDSLREMFTKLEELLQSKADEEGKKYHGVQLARKVTSKEKLNPPSQLSDKSQQSFVDNFGNFLAGLMGCFRNPLDHQSSDSLESWLKEEHLKILLATVFLAYELTKKHVK